MILIQIYSEGKAVTAERKKKQTETCQKWKGRVQKAETTVQYFFI